MGTLTYESLAKQLADSEIAAARVTATYEPIGGPGSRVLPPTYPVPDRAEDKTPYVIERRRRGDGTAYAVVLDQAPSQANRAEEAMLGALRDGSVSLPELRIEHAGAVDLTLSALELPHRVFDAYLMACEIEGTKFDRTEIGKALQSASASDASAILRHDPGSLVFGCWNSHRRGRQARFPRIYTSEILGWEPEVGRRKAGRMDPTNLVGGRQGDAASWTYSAVGTKGKNGRLSEIGLGNIAPNDAHGGVTVSGCDRIATLSLTGARRLRFGALGKEAQVAAHTLLAAYALLADRLAFGLGSLWLRSGCDLLVLEEKLQWVGRGGVVDDFDLDVEGALQLYDQSRRAAETAGVELALAPIVLTPGASLAAAIDFSLTKAETAGE